MTIMLATASGIFLPEAVVAHELAAELFAEGDWHHCRIECERILSERPDRPAVQLMRAQSLARLGLATPQTFTPLLDQSGVPRDILAAVHYELGLMAVSRHDWPEAFSRFETAFTTTGDPDAWARSGYYLHQLGRKRSLRQRRSAALQFQLRACRSLWTTEIRSTHRLTPPRLRRAATAPAVAVIRFYQRQIAPAIGSRCSLEPSCSRYAVAALHAHGWRGIPMLADRSVREPDVVAARQSPVMINGRPRFQDPISDHDWWFRR